MLSRTAIRSLVPALFIIIVVVPMRPTRSVAQVRPAPQLRVSTDTATVQEVRLLDGTKLIGHVTTIEGERFTFRTVGGLTVDLWLRDVRKVREVEGFHENGEFWERDAGDSRLFVFPTARVPAHGSGYFGVYELLMPSFGVGVGGVGMVSGGMSMVPGIALSEQIFYVAPKLRLFHSEFVDAAVGAMWFQPGESNEGAALGLGVITAGTEKASMTFGIGLPLHREREFSSDVGYLIGGEARVDRNVKLMSENWILAGEGSAHAFGVRILAGRVLVELAGVTTSDADYLLPLVNVTLTW